MAVPRNRLSNARKNKRRAHHAVAATSLSNCRNCGEAHRPHSVCSSCGYYKGRAVVEMQEAE